MHSDQLFRKGSGKANFSIGYDQNQLVESFQLGSVNQTFEGIAYLNKSTAHNRYELFQIDKMSSRRSTIFLIGQMENEQLVFNSNHLRKLGQWGSSDLIIKWIYTFDLKEKTFKKEIFKLNESNECFVQSYYIYTFQE